MVNRLDDNALESGIIKLQRMYRRLKSQRDDLEDERREIDKKKSRLESMQKEIDDQNKRLDDRRSKLDIAQIQTLDQGQSIANVATNVVSKIETIEQPKRESSGFFSGLFGKKKKDESASKEDATKDDASADPKPKHRKKRRVRDSLIVRLFFFPPDLISSKVGMLRKHKTKLRVLWGLIILTILGLVIWGFYELATFENRESMPSLEVDDKNSFKFKATDNQGSGLTLASVDRKAVAYPDNNDGARVWTYNKNNYTICSAIDGLCLKKDNDAIMIDSPDTSNAFKWYLDMNHGKIVNIEDDIVVANLNGTKVVASKKSGAPGEFWKFTVV